MGRMGGLSVQWHKSAEPRDEIWILMMVPVEGLKGCVLGSRGGGCRGGDVWSGDRRVVLERG